MPRPNHLALMCELGKAKTREKKKKKKKPLKSVLVVEDGAK